MANSTLSTIPTHHIADLHSHFLVLLPKIETHGKIFFRHLNPHKKEEILQEMRALAWLWFLQLARRGKNASEFLAAFTRLLARAVNCGRRVTGMEKAKDVMNRRNQKRNGFLVESLCISTRELLENLNSRVHGQQEKDAFEERLQDNTKTPVPEQAAFRIDWPAWMKTRTDRDRKIIKDLMAGERTQDVSKRFGLSQGRVSQMRWEFRDHWRQFCGVEEPAAQSVSA